ncbi:hypothetical protein CDD83_2812 [Cordyceps sp. RAO-2017]|nr:hypothetical protein CDD83_2812 [Cordyceps sp. RAO-2017]
MSAEPRAKFQYNNIMYASMGYLIEHLTNTTLADFFRDRLWHPMGMKNTYLHPDDALAKDEDLAHAYYWNNDTEAYGEIPWSDERNIAGAGMAISSVRDMSRYLRHMLDETGPISKAGHKAIKRPRVVYDNGDHIFDHPVSYGLGWSHTVVENEDTWFHTGRVNDMISVMLIVPSRDFGFVFMMNKASVVALESIMSKVFSYLFKTDPGKHRKIEEM